MQRKKRKLKEDDDSDEEEGTDHIRQEGNKVYFYSDVTKKTALDLMSKLFKAAQEAVIMSSIEIEPTVYLYIHSNGGDAYVGLSLHDQIKSMKIRIVTIATGFVASSASLILLAGHEKLGLQNCQILIHQLRTEFWGKFDELLDEVKNSKKLMKCVKQLYKDCAIFEEKDLENLLKKELNLSAKQSLKYGLIDRIV